VPRQLGADPRNWVAVLERLSSQTVERDRKGWHAISYDPPQTIGNRVIYPVVTTETTSIGKIPSRQVVAY
jgi:hypothetical protein